MVRSMTRARCRQRSPPNISSTGPHHPPVTCLSTHPTLKTHPKPSCVCSLVIPLTFVSGTFRQRRGRTEQSTTRCSIGFVTKPLPLSSVLKTSLSLRQKLTIK
ncbi:hypothetical protein BDQ94DRAFT_150945 [Aspergillus welwitschiae]|uniref:Uncharacterized protein n=1 Tax=Aspergillus welwitschiae TaxID=1341132 RepID=A0A3F3PQ57_9EURO|nr:hypothetical protein BDQ94DRAFT_150945 [Aspergillus welwitschiae]RDH29081.1 hypothetical protein BDQ94DRAFT_150945 [Aspergillus welwitschiae]